MNIPQQFAQATERVGVTTAVGSGLWGWMAENHQVIASVGVIVGIAVGVIGLLINWWYLHKSHKKGRGA